MISKEAFKFYTSQSAITDPKEYSYLFDNLPSSISELCEIVHGIISHRDSSELYDLELTEQRKQEGETRYIDLILKRINELDNNPLTKVRPPEKRFAGTCRDFAIMLCSILRYQGVPARIRCGYANYFTQGKYEDHWVCEYWNSDISRWILVDAEVDDIYKRYFKITIDVNDIPRDRFLTGGQAWKECKSGKLNPDLFGLTSIGLHGIGEVRGNTVRDLIALNKVELLPWDDIEISDKKFDELTKTELDLINFVAEITSPDSEDFTKSREIYQDPRLKVPGVVKSYTTYNGIIMVKIRN